MTKSSAIVSLLLAGAQAVPQDFQDLREPILNEDCKDLALGLGLLHTGRILFIPDLAVEEVSHVFRAAFYS